jgi:hypothetical protein
MASGKQRRSIIKAKRTVRKAKAEALKPARAPKPVPAGSAPVNEVLLAPYKSYGAPQFVYRGHLPRHRLHLSELRQRRNLDRDPAEMVVRDGEGLCLFHSQIVPRLSPQGPGAKE